MGPASPSAKPPEPVTIPTLEIKPRANLDKLSTQLHEPVDLVVENLREQAEVARLLGRLDQAARQHRRREARRRRLAPGLRRGASGVGVAMADPTPTPPRDSDDRSVAELVFDVSEKTSALIRNARTCL